MSKSLDCLTQRVIASDVPQLSPAALAYVGDAVYELYVRTAYLTPPARLHAYHQRVVASVRAEAQAAYLQRLQPHLTPPELALLKQGRNAAARGPKRVDPEIYQQATSLETLLGFLYLTNPARLGELLAWLPLEQEAIARCSPLATRPRETADPP